MKLFRAMATVAGMTALSRVAGFARDIMTAAFLGAGPVADAFFVALKLPNFFRRVTAEGAFSVSFVPIYSAELAQEGEESAALFANRVFSLMLWMLSAFTVLAMLAMPVIINLIAPGFSDEPEKYHMAVAFSRITFPYLLLMSLTSLLGGVMNAHDKFAPFAFAPVLFNLSLIGALALSGRFESAGVAMSWGVLVAGVLQFALLLLTARLWIGFRLRLVRPQITPRVKRLFRLMGPGVVGAGVVQINLFADMIIGSFLPTGSISYLYYADRLNQLPLSTVGIAVGTALLPMLSRAVAAGKHEVARHLFSRALEITLFLGLPAALALVLLAHPIIAVLFQRGAFSAEAAQATAFVLQGYVIGLPAYIGVKVFSTAFWSQQDTLTPVKISAIVVLANIILALSFIPFIGVAGIALATGLVGWLQLFLLARPLKKHPELYPDVRFKAVLPKIILSTALMGGVVFIAGLWLIPYTHLPGVMRYMALAGLVASGIIAYGLAVQVTGALRLSDLKRYFSKSEV
ncbi:MAG: murein biosynthesis integral membrane protein MurJ [Alphaproteobacteria bacterium]|nr:murein biosynthesis integral membrane protein MurJ [Alphaproteobacteria bacterium]